MRCFDLIQPFLALVGINKLLLAIMDTPRHGSADVTVDSRAITILVGLEASQGVTGAQADMSGAAVAFVFFLCVFGSGETFECIKDVLEDLGVNVTGPEKIKVFVMGNLGGHRLGWQFAKHDFDVYERINAAVDEDNRSLDVAGGILGDLGVLAAGG